MKTVLCLTDFSEASGFALDLAEKMAELLDAKVHVLHVVETPGGASFDEAGHCVDDGEIDMDAHRRKVSQGQAAMNELLRSHASIAAGEIREGLLTDWILETARETRAILLCLATKGAYGLKEWLSDSETAVLARRCPVPVLSLKCDRSGFQLRHMLLVGQDDEIHTATCPLIRELQKSSGATVARLNIASGVDAERTITHALQERHIDLIAVGVSDHHSPIGLFKTDLARTLVNHFHMPILTFHHADEYAHPS